MVAGVRQNSGGNIRSWQINLEVDGDEESWNSGMMLIPTSYSSI